MANESTSKPVVRAAIRQWTAAQQKQKYHLQAALKLKREMEYLSRIIDDGYTAAS
jgi:hypothetical protein